MSFQWHMVTFIFVSSFWGAMCVIQFRVVNFEAARRKVHTSAKGEKLQQEMRSSLWTIPTRALDQLPYNIIKGLQTHVERLGPDFSFPYGIIYIIDHSSTVHISTHHLSVDAPPFQYNPRVSTHRWLKPLNQAVKYPIHWLWPKIWYKCYE